MHNIEEGISFFHQNEGRASLSRDSRHSYEIIIIFTMITSDDIVRCLSI
jgi:hypothetical protein